MKPLASLSHNRNSSWACSSIVAGGPGVRPCSHPSSSWASPAPGFPGLAMEVGSAFGGLSRAEKKRGERRRAGRAGARAKQERWAPRGGAQRSLPAPMGRGRGPGRGAARGRVAQLKAVAPAGGGLGGARQAPGHPRSRRCRRGCVGGGGLGAALDLVTENEVGARGRGQVLG